jgi:hypothetical protein
MAVVTQTWNTTVDTNWITSTGWVSSDPAYKLHQELDAWVTAIGDSSIINIQATPNDATSKSGASGVAWVLQTRDGDTGSDWGILFHPRRADSNPSYYTDQWPNLGGTGHNYYGRTSGSSNNGYGSFSVFGYAALSAETLGSAANFFTAYDATGDTPWFLYSYENSAKTDRRIYGMFRLNTDDLTPNSYYPPSGISKWIYFYADNSGAISYYWSPIKNLGLPFKGLYLSGYLNFVSKGPVNNANTAGFFFRTLPQYGDVHYIGKITQDLLVSNSSTGVWGDSINIESSDYICLGNYTVSGVVSQLWIKVN